MVYKIIDKEQLQSQLLVASYTVHETFQREHSQRKI